MTDPAASEIAARWGAYLHPAWMVIALGGCVAALRIGLGLRRAYQKRTAPPQGARALHLRIAKPAVVAVLIGAIGGPLSVWLFRDWTPMSTFHAVLGGTTAVLFGGAALQGRRLEQGDRSARNAHAWLGGGAVVLGLAAAIAGFVLLP
ncbi:MAG: DUF4079 family protein [Myxococcota bacterium]